MDDGYPPPGEGTSWDELGELANCSARPVLRIERVAEETSLDVTLMDLLGVYSDPARDARQHTISTVYVGRAVGTPRASDDAADARVFTETTLPHPLAFDHARILADYFRFRRTGERPRPAVPARR